MVLKTNIVLHFGVFIEYFTNDSMAISCVGSGKKWESHILEFVRKYDDLFGISNIIDVGANFGYHSLFFSRLLNETSQRKGLRNIGKVFAFEPQCQNYELLTRNIHHNADTENIISYPLACSNNSEDILMPIIDSSFSDGDRINMGDFTPNCVDNGLGMNSVVKSVTLDSMDFPRIDIIKIDVQGWEIKVLEGARTLIEKNAPILIVEFEHFQMSKTGASCADLVYFIRCMGYEIFYLEYEYPSDHICVPFEKLEEFYRLFGDCIFEHSEDNEINHNIFLGIHKKIVLRG